MNYHFEPSANAATLHTDCVVVGIYKDAKMTAAAQLDTASNGAIHNHLALGDFNGEKGRSVMLYQLAGVTAKRVLLVGMGEKDKLTLEILAAATQAAVNALKTAKVANVIAFLTDETRAEYVDAGVRQSVTTIADALYSFNTHKSKKDEPPTLSAA